MAHKFARQVKAGRSMQKDIDRFGEYPVVTKAGGMSVAGRPRLPFRLMISLLYLKHAFNESVEGTDSTPGHHTSQIQRIQSSVKNSGRRVLEREPPSR